MHDGPDIITIGLHVISLYVVTALGMERVARGARVSEMLLFPLDLSVVIHGLERAVHLNTKRGIVTRVLEGDRVAVVLELVRQLASVTQSTSA